MPIRDWQFWVVTALFIGGLWLIVRVVVPAKNRNGKCPTCPSGSAKRRVPLTIDRRPTSGRR
jgi:hypothetical protein